MRGLSIFLGAGLCAFGGLTLALGGNTWLGPLDLVLGLATMAASLLPLALRRPRGTVGTTRVGDRGSQRMLLAVGVLLLALWVVGLYVGAPVWVVWWTFGFAVAFLFFSIAGPGSTTYNFPYAGVR